MLENKIIKNSHAVSQMFQFLCVFGIDRFKVIHIDDIFINASIGWPDNGRDDYDPIEEVQEVSWTIDRDPSLDHALMLLHQLSKNDYIDSDRITASEVEIEKLSNQLMLDHENTLVKLLSVRIDMLDDDRKTDFFFLHLGGSCV